MTKTFFHAPSPFVTQKRKTHIKLRIVKNENVSDWLKKQEPNIRKNAVETGFDQEESLILTTHHKNGNVKDIIVRMGERIGFYDMARVVNRLTTQFSSHFLKTASFEITGIKPKDMEMACVSWGLAAYSFDAYKKNSKENAVLLWPTEIDKKRIKTQIESIALLRNLVNTPANDLGPQELEDVVNALAEKHKATLKITKGKTLEKKFPLVHAVGTASPRAPRLIDMTWGKTTDPKVTLVGKGVCFDTGGLDLKPSQYMKLMKKDMGGAAHTIAVAKMIMDLKLPVRLRLIIPAVENSVAGESFRPGDVFTSRKGITVENTNTDAEGRLILADALTLASEDKPDIIIDFATLTGSARAALGPDIPAMFSNEDKIGASLQKISMDSEDPLWQMPLWAPYKKHIESSTAELHNSAGIPGDLIYSAIFLESFLVGKPDWIHIDTYAWEQTGKPGRPKGAADCGMRAVFTFLEQRYG